MLTVFGYELDPDRAYDAHTDLWVKALGDERVRIGYDPLGADATGDIVAISFAALGTRLARGETFATVEAAKFVGPLAAPVGGRLLTINDEVLAAPGSINADPLGVWLVELGEVVPAEFEHLLIGEAAVRPWFAAAVERYRREGAIAE